MEEMLHETLIPSTSKSDNNHESNVISLKTPEEARKFGVRSSEARSSGTSIEKEARKIYPSYHQLLEKQRKK